MSKSREQAINLIFRQMMDNILLASKPYTPITQRQEQENSMKKTMKKKMKKMPGKCK